MSILVTGGAGFIGSHAIVELLNEGHSVVAIDNLSNSKNIAIKRIQDITGKAFEFVEGDIRDAQLLKDLFSKHSINSVMHFAGLKAVGDSVANPLAYYGNNIAGSVCLYKAMEEAKVFNLVFSSSATVYGDPQKIPIDETHPTGAVTNPYGQTKYMNELICADLVRSNPQWNIGILRYFNIVGSSKSGKIGLINQGDHLFKNFSKQSLLKNPVFKIYGTNYKTKDGSCIRDFIHVSDLAQIHNLSAKYLIKNKKSQIFNCGYGTGFSIMDVINSMNIILKSKLPFEIGKPRKKDIHFSVANIKKFNKYFNWKPKYNNLKYILTTALNWEKIQK